MVRLGLLDASDDDEEFTTARSPYAAPTEADDSEDEQPHAAADRTPRRSFSPGGLFSRSDGSGRAEAAGRARPPRPGRPARSRCRRRRAVAPRARAAAAPRRRAGAGPARRGRRRCRRHHQSNNRGKRPARGPRASRRHCSCSRRRGARGACPSGPSRSSATPACGWRGASGRPSAATGASRGPSSAARAFFVEIKRVRTTDADPEPALNAALAHLLPEAEAAPQELPSRALPACPAYDDDLYAASAARAAVAKAVHAYGKAHAGRLREAFELVGALWLHDATATHVERPTVASAWARELRRAARDDAVGSWLAARARARSGTRETASARRSCPRAARRRGRG